MKNMRIVAGCPITERGWIVDEWAACLRNQSNFDIELVCLYSDSFDDTWCKLHDNGVHVLRHDSLPLQTPSERLMHAWNGVQTGKLATLRNTLESYVRDEYDPDLWLSIDSDMLLPDPRSVLRLSTVIEEMGYDAVGPLTSMSPYEECPNFMFDVGTHYERPVDVGRYYAGSFVSGVDALFGVKLCNRKALAVRWAANGQGEDLGWARNASAAGVRMAVDTSVRATHRMTYVEP